MPNLITIPFTLLDTSGQPVDADSVTITFSTPGVAVSSQPMTRIAQGVYSYAFFDTGAGLYAYTIETTIGADTQDINGTTSISSYYAPLARVQQMYGATDIATWSNLDNNVSSTLDAGTVQDAMIRTDNFFNRKLREFSLVSPLPSSSADWSYIQDLAVEYAGVMIYLSRGRANADAGSDLAGKMQAHLDNVLQELDRILETGIDAASSVANESTGGIDVVSQIDPTTGLSNLPHIPRSVVCW